MQVSKLLNTNCHIVLDPCEEKTLHWRHVTSFDKAIYSPSHKDTFKSRVGKPQNCFRKQLSYIQATSQI